MEEIRHQDLVFKSYLGEQLPESFEFETSDDELGETNLIKMTKLLYLLIRQLNWDACSCVNPCVKEVLGKQ